jgi:SAM-dependent MidA family methyltransferase
LARRSQAEAQVAGHEGRAEFHVLLEAHHLEALAHLAGQGQALHFLRALEAFALVGDAFDPLQHAGQAVAEQEARAAGEAGRYALRQQAKQLTLPAAMGERFQAMGFARGVEFGVAFLAGDLSFRL